MDNLPPNPIIPDNANKPNDQEREIFRLQAEVAEAQNAVDDVTSRLNRLHLEYERSLRWNSVRTQHEIMQVINIVVNRLRHLYRVYINAVYDLGIQRLAPYQDLPPQTHE